MANSKKHTLICQVHLVHIVLHKKKKKKKKKKRTDRAYHLLFLYTIWANLASCNVEVYGNELTFNM